MKLLDLQTNLKKLYLDNKLFSSIIIESKDDEDSQKLIKEITRLLYCKNNSFDSDDCINCSKSSDKKIFDLIQIGDGYTSVTKQEVQDVITKMSLTSLEDNKNKVYIINGIENLKTEALNSILKFLEEPPANTYAFLLSKDRSKVLPTIKSRCKLFVLEFNESDFIENEFETLIKQENKVQYFIQAETFKKMDKSKLINLVEESYNRTILKFYPQFAKVTLELIDELKFMPVTNLAIENYFIKIAEVL